MAGLVGELDDLVLDRRAIARPAARQVTAVNSRFVKPLGDNGVGALIGIGDATGDLRPVNRLGQVGKRLDRIVAKLLFQAVPVNGLAVKARRCARLQAPHVELEIV